MVRYEILMSLVTKNASIPLGAKENLSFLTLGFTVEKLFFDKINDRAQSEDITVGLEPADLALADRGDQGCAAKVFPGIDVGEMHLNRRDVHGGNGVADGDARMRVSGGVDEDGQKPILLGPANGVDNLPLMIGLQDIQLNPFGFGQPLQCVVDLFKGGLSVNVFLALSQKVQIWAVND